MIQVESIPLFFSVCSSFRRPRFLRGEGEGSGSSGGVGGALAQGSEVAISWEINRAMSRSDGVAVGNSLDSSKDTGQNYIYTSYTVIKLRNMHTFLGLRQISLSLLVQSRAGTSSRVCLHCISRINTPRTTKTKRHVHT